jgi:phosphate-selective porin OprO/OprP
MSHFLRAPLAPAPALTRAATNLRPSRTRATTVPGSWPAVVRTGALLALALAGAAPAGLAQARTPEPTRDSAQVVYDDDGLRIHSADRRKQFKVRAYAVLEAREVLSDTSDASTNNFNLKRSRVIFDANLYPGIAARVMYDVGPPSGTSPIQDAYVDAGLGGGWWLRAGKQKTPVGLERYMSISAQLLPDRSLASNLHAGRDLGVLVTGPLGSEAVEVAIGVFNGVPDGGANQDTDANDDKDLTYRLWLKPYRHKMRGAEQGFGIAYNGSTGIEGGPGGSQLPTFKSQAVQTFFSYGAGVVARGRHSRNGVFSYFHHGPVGTMAEWFSNSQVVARGTSVATVHTGGWLVNAQYSLSGEPSAQEGITPKDAFDPATGHWGAWQVGARVAALNVGDNAFPVYADSTVAARGAFEVGVGLNWYLTRQTKMQLAYENTTFRGGAKVGDRKTERYVQLRWQAYF